MTINTTDYLSMLGCPASDKVTRFKGVITSVSFDLYGCVQVILDPPADSEGKRPEIMWIDAKRVVITGTPVMDPPSFISTPKGEEAGPAHKPPMAKPPRRS